MLLFEDRFHSSAIAAVAYECISRTLFVIFTADTPRRRVWRYERVPRECYEAFVAAESQGRYFHDHVRAPYEARQLSAEEIELLRARVAAPSGPAPPIPWLEQLGQAAAAQDPLGLFF